MENIKIWTFSLCGALFITAIFRIIISGSRLEKSVNIFLSVFIFLYAVLPINDLEFNIDSYLDINEYNTAKIYNDGYENIIKESIKKICQDKNIPINSITVDSYINDNGDYVVNQIIVESDIKNNKDYIKSIIKSELGFEVKVIWIT